MLDRATFVAAEKRLTGITHWIDDGSPRLKLTSTLDIGDVTAEGFLFRASALATQPDRGITLQLEFHPPTADGGALARIEWRPVSDHNNRGLGPPEWRHVVQSSSHVHPFGLNWTEVEGRVRRGVLPIAIPIHPDPNSFAELLEWAAKEFNIANLEGLPLPPWRPVLL